MGGLSVTLLALLLASATVAAEPIQGRLTWTDAAEIEGRLQFGQGAPAHAVHAAAPGAPAGRAWHLETPQLMVVQSTRESNRPPLWNVAQVDLATDPEWKNTVHRFDDAVVTIRGAPTPTWGSSAVVFADQPQLGSFRWTPPGPVAVRHGDFDEAVMTVPSGPGPQSHAAYTHEVPGHVLRLDGHGPLDVEGAFQLVLFGFRVTVAEPGREPVTFEAGFHTTEDELGRPSGTRTEFLRIRGWDAQFASGPDDWTVYSPAAGYQGSGAFPQGHYQGLADHLVPRGDDRLVLDGTIMLAADLQEDAVHASGDADWTRPQAAVLPQPKVPTSLAAPLALVGAALVLGSSWTQALARLAQGAAFAAYARLRDRDGEDASPTRARILDLIHRDPGTNLSRIVRELDIGWGTAAYHTQILRRQRRVRLMRTLNRLCFFPIEEGGETRQLQAVLLRQPNYRLVMQTLQARPGLSQREVAEGTGHARQYISRLVAKLEQASLVKVVSSPSGRRYYPVGPAAEPSGPLGPDLAMDAPVSSH